MATALARSTIGPADAGRPMTLAEFVAADYVGAHHRYELARGIVVVTEIPRLSHGRIVRRITRMLVYYDDAHPKVVRYAAGSGECRLRLPGMQSDRHPDQAVYITRPPQGKRIWERWTPAIVVEVVSRRGEDRDYVEKREEYLRCGVLEYWIFDPMSRKLIVLKREGDTWAEQVLGDQELYQTELLPGLVVSVGEILGAPVAEDEADPETGAEPEDDEPLPAV